MVPRSGAVPTGATNAGRFGKFRRNALQRVFGDAGDVDLDVEYAGDANLAQDLARHDVEILETLEHSHERGGISVGDDSQAQQRQFVQRHKTGSSYTWRIEPIPFLPGLQRRPGW